MPKATEMKASWIRSLVPHPLLTVVLIGLWLMLINQFSAGGLVVGVILGLLIPKYTTQFWPDRPVIRKPWHIFPFVAILLFDILIANVQVAYLILFRRSDQLQSRWISVPLDLCSPEGITALASTITLTPGTVSSDVSADGKCLLVHCLNLDSEAAMVRRIKDRYERRIQAMLT